ncbi:ribonuclease H-like domain-containing protein [Tanacetum coccineum]
MAEQDTPPPTITAMKIPIIKKGEYDIWSMRMRQYIYHTNHNLWDIIVNGDLQEELAPIGEQSGPFALPAPKTAKQLTAKRNQEREAIKSRFGGNDESKKMQRNVLKHQFENFTTAPNKSLDKAYDRFQKLISQFEVYAALISKEDINQKFLRSLPPSWSQIALIMRNKPDIDQTDIDDIYNNLRVYEDEMKRSSNSTSNSHNLAFRSSENTSNTNEVSSASRNFRVSTAGRTSSSSHISSTPCTDKIDQDDLEELDLRWQVAMLTVKVKRFILKTGRNLDFKEKQHVSFDKSKVECYNCHMTGHFARECKLGRNQGKRSYGDNGRKNAPTNKPSSQALVAQDGLGGYDWSNDFDEPVNYALMAISSSSSSSSSKNKVQNCSKQCLESFKTLQKNFDSEREKHNRARLEIQGYELALESLESRILRHEKNELAWGEKYEFQNYELKFSKADGYHVVPPPITGNFLTTRADISFATELKTDTSKSKTSETVGNTNEVNVEKPMSVYEQIESTPNINRDKVIIEDWNSDDEDDVSKTVSPVKTNETQTVKTQVDKVGVLTRTGLINPVRSNEKRAAQTVNTVRPINTARPYAPKLAQTSSAIGPIYLRIDNGNPEILLQDQEVVDSGCSSHITGNKAYLLEYEDYNGGFVAFRSDPKGGKITGKGKIRTANLDFDDVYFVDELKFNIFYVSQMCDKKNSVLFTDTECLILSPSFKLLDESQVVLRAPRQNDVYSLDLKNIVPSGGKPPSISFIRPFGCPLTILNTLDPLGKFDGKSNEGYLLGYSTTSKAFRVYNKRTKRVEENMHIDFLKDQPNVARIGPNWIVENQVKLDAEDVVQTAQEKPSKNAPKDKDVQDSEAVAKNEEQQKLKEAEQALKDDLERMVAQEMAAKTMDDATRRAFEE